MDEILQLKDAAELLGITPSGTRWLIDCGKLPAQRTASGQRILKRSDVETFAAKRDALKDERRSHVA
jgi:excisionase family DNA binding protein